MKDYYKILEVSPSVSNEVIHMAYKVLVKKYHADGKVSSSEANGERIKEINEAYGVLSDSLKRSRYDDSYYANQAKADSSAQYTEVDDSSGMEGSTPMSSVASSVFIILRNANWTSLSKKHRRNTKIYLGVIAGLIVLCIWGGTFLANSDSTSEEMKTVVDSGSDLKEKELTSNDEQSDELINLLNETGSETGTEEENEQETELVTTVVPATVVPNIVVRTTATRTTTASPESKSLKSGAKDSESQKNSVASKLEYDCNTLIASQNQYDYSANPYIADGTTRLLEMLNSIYKAVNDKQEVEEITLEQILKDNKISGKFIKEILSLEGADVFTDSRFSRMDYKENKSFIQGLSKNQLRRSYFELSSMAQNNVTNSEAYYYIGGMKNNRPNKEGMLLHYTREGLLYIAYIGGFSNGQMSGRGVRFAIMPFGYAVNIEGTYKENELNGKATTYYSEDIFSTYTYYTSAYMDFIDEYSSNHTEDEVLQTIEKIIKNNPMAELFYSSPMLNYTDHIVRVNGKLIKPIINYSGNYKSGDYDGKGTLYGALGSIIYEGEFKNGKYNGKGTLYYDMKNVPLYKGEFKNNKYNGKGTLYEDNGDVRKKATFKNEDPDTKLAGAMQFQGIADTFWRMDIEGKLFKIDDADSDVSVEAEKQSNSDVIVNGKVIYREYILPHSSDQYLTESDLEGLDKATLRLARNEIYAKHGRIFQSEDLDTYFNNQPWYHGTTDADHFDESVLNDFEKKNLDLIKSIENR